MLNAWDLVKLFGQGVGHQFNESLLGLNQDFYGSKGKPGDFYHGSIMEMRDTVAYLLAEGAEDGNKKLIRDATKYIEVMDEYIQKHGGRGFTVQSDFYPGARLGKKYNVTMFYHPDEDLVHTLIDPSAITGFKNKKYK